MLELPLDPVEGEDPSEPPDVPAFAAAELPLDPSALASGPDEGVFVAGAGVATGVGDVGEFRPGIVAALAPLVFAGSLPGSVTGAWKPLSF